MRIIHLNTVAKLYHRFMTWYSISPPFKRSCTHPSLLGTFCLLLERKKIPTSHFQPLSPRSVVPLRCGQVEMPLLTKVWMPHLWESLLPRGKITANFSQPLPVPLEHLFCLISVCLHWAVYSPNINCVTTMYPAMCQAWLNFWSYCHGLPFCEETRNERKHCWFLKDFKAISCALSCLTMSMTFIIVQSHLTLNMVQLKCPWVLSGTQKYGWAPLGVWLGIRSLVPWRKKLDLQSSSISENNHCICC